VILLSNDVDGFENEAGQVVERITVPKISSLLDSHAWEGYENGAGGIDSKLWAMACAAKALPGSEIIFGNARKSPLAMILGECICTRVVQ
jgi:isopentenyl phosphate kinase